MTNRNKTCEERIDNKLNDRLIEIRYMLNQKGNILKDMEGNKYDGLRDWLDCWSLAIEDDPVYKARNLELSVGGPSDGFRFYRNGQIEYYFQDWWDGAKRILFDKDYAVLKKLYDDAMSF